MKMNGTANLRTTVLDFRGLDSSRILILRGGILMSIGNILESLSQAIVVGIILVGRLGVLVFQREGITEAIIGIVRCPLFTGPLIISLYVFIWPYLARCSYK